ncbi:MAG: hypothetical protein ACLFSJ_05480 [Halorhodospira sp.]
MPVQHDLNPYLQCLRFDGVHILLGLLEPVEPALEGGNLVMRRRVLAGSLIGGMPETQEVLDFCAERGITCDIEMLDIADINEAYERVKAGDLGYRPVIDMEASSSHPCSPGRRQQIDRRHDAGVAAIALGHQALLADRGHPVVQAAEHGPLRLIGPPDRQRGAAQLADAPLHVGIRADLLLPHPAGQVVAAQDARRHALRIDDRQAPQPEPAR